MSQSKVSKIENGRVTPTVLDVDRILKALSVPSTVADEVLGLARLANTQFHDVRSSIRRGLHHRQRDLAALEASARQFRYFLPVMITGLLHTPAYARRSLSRFPGDQSETIARRLERQAVLQDESRSFCFVLTEAAIRWSLCPPTEMAEQLDHLVSVSLKPNVTVGIVPLAAEVPGTPLNTFTVYDDRLVTVETIGGLVVMHDPRDVALHLEVFEFFRGHAVADSGARAVIRQIADDFRARRPRGH